MFTSLSADRFIGGLLQVRRDAAVHLFAAACLVALWRWLPGSHEHGWSYALWWLGALLTLLALTLLLGWALTTFLLPNAKLSSRGKAVLVTGCDRGFGRLLAKRLDSEGYKVFAGCLFPEQSRSELEEASSSGLRVVPLDVTDDKQVAEAVTLVERELAGQHQLWGVVCNAGVNIFTEFEWTTQREVSWMFDVNVHGTVRVTRAFLPLLRRSRGRLVFVASYAGRVAPVWIVPYAMTKAAVIALADGLRRELAQWGVGVSTIEPTYYVTEINPRVEQDLLKRFAAVPDHVRAAYGEGYARDRCRAMVRFLSSVSRCELSEVVDAMAHALTRARPRRYYRCDGTAGWLLALLLFNLPSMFADSAVAMTWKSRYAPDARGVLQRVRRQEDKVA
ncbi:retinol dehydrogenase 5-like isoform X1 [Dermacentor albipictus]|uniref:retinol dehydrogenase 5-like isoform X1 n=1 Tax=Dermacentor albipictus TaxID=60249 RepID=UPI0031FD3706